MKNNNFIKTNILFKGLVFLLLVGLFWIYSISGEGVKVQAANSTISSISQLQDKLNSVTGDENIYLTNDFVTDFLANSQNVTFQYSGNYNITIDGSNLTVPISGALPSLIWDFNNSGTGNITFNKLTFGNPDNSSTENIQIALAGSGEFLFENCNFYKLNSSRSIITGGLKLDIKNCLFSGNASACLFPGNDEEVNVYNSTFIDNTNRAIDCNGANVKLNLCNTLFKNNVSTEGGAIHYSTVWNYGTEINIDKCMFEDNKASGTDGGAISVKCEGGSASTPDVPQVKINITDSYFTHNHSADDGGAICMSSDASKTNVNSKITNCTFTNNVCVGEIKLNLVSSGSGGAIQFYQLTNSEVTNCTFYGNEVDAAASGKTGTKGGGAVAVDAGASTTYRLPILSNNIFVGNKLLGFSSYSKYANVYVTTNANPDPATGPLVNNGNIGYDNNKDSNYDLNGESVSEGITVKNVFAKVDDNGVPIPETYGVSAGSNGSSEDLISYTPSPVSDELYRDGSGPYYNANTVKDVRGYTRDHYPNAGAIEIYWTRFDPGVKGAYEETVSGDTINADLKGKWKDGSVDFLNAGGIESLKYPGTFYLITTPPSPSELAGEVLSYPESTFELTTAPSLHTVDDYGFIGWRCSKPSNPGAAHLNYSIIQPNTLVRSMKQIYTATYEQGKFRVDFEMKKGNENMLDPSGWYIKDGETPILHVVKGSLISKPTNPTRTGYTFIAWYNKANDKEWNFSKDKVTKDTILYGTWKLNSSNSGNDDKKIDNKKIPKKHIYPKVVKITKVTTKTKNNVKTGDNNNVLYYLSSIILMSVLAALILRNRKHNK